MSLLRKSQHGNAWHKRRPSFREKPMRGSALLQAPGTPPPPPLPQRIRPAPPWEATQDPAGPVRPAEGYRQLPSVADLTEQVTQAMPPVTRPAPRAEADVAAPDFRLAPARFPVDRVLATLPKLKLTYPHPFAPLSAYDDVMQVVSALTGTTAEPDVWIRPAVESAVTSDEEITAWERYRDADMLARLAAARRAVAGRRS